MFGVIEELVVVNSVPYLVSGTSSVAENGVPGMVVVLRCVLEEIPQNHAGPRCRETKVLKTWFEPGEDVCRGSVIAEALSRIRELTRPLAARSTAQSVG